MSESYMEKALLKLARQINAFDEASLMSLWEKYAEKVRHFEPTKRWEESVVVFNLIQSTRLKNQLFNYNWAQSRMPDAAPHEIDFAALTSPEKRVADSESGANSTGPELVADEQKKDRRGKLLTLTPKNTK
ncbi:hypothetical protein SYK_12390 [Pseudodesulfovibrio nedwellii]|uniref:Uncharacterized protein n=1 Tax=Pseudodesulfovibrio nedwellii TaxID=2973072 RepID=A0ABN6S0Y7_9BACT|nr:hypothetical protein [Pseudodesulfovibrio nedwellii]BDQ36879.1 hypothetical protein SYK_12390 [Pseudodesulfovibrio nedwellii]